MAVVRENPTSMLCVRQPGGAMKVHDKHFTPNFFAELDKNYTRPQVVPKNSDDQRSSVRPYSSPTKLNCVDSGALVGHTLKLQEWLNETQVKAIQVRTDQEAKATKQMYNAVLGTEDTFVKDVADFLSYKQLLDDRKKKVLHKQWNNSVYQPIQKEIEKEINGTSYAELSKRKRELHKEYLEHVNKKGHVFLDTIAPEEYYPMSLHPIRPSLLVAETNRLTDPLLSQQRARSAEDRIVFRCLTGHNFTDGELASMKLPPLPLVPKGRHGTNSNTWLEMPMGNIESPVRKASRRRMCGGYNTSQFAFTDWTKKFDNRLVDDEMQLQKRRRYLMEHMVSRVPIFEQQQDASTQRDE